MTAINILVAIFSFGFIIFFHELFHYIAARLVGIKPKEFSIGFGKSLIVYQKRKFYFLPKKGSEKFNLDEISYHIKVLPLGGYVLFERPVINEKGDYELKGDYLKIHPLKRIFIAISGPIGNFILAFILLFSLLTPYMSLHKDGKVIYVQEKSIADSVGIKPQDNILKFNDKEIGNVNNLSQYIKSQDNLCITWKNEKEVKKECVQNSNNKIGVTFSMTVWEGLIHTSESFLNLFKSYTSAFFEVLMHLNIKDFNGPIGTIDAIQQTVPVFEKFFSILVLINIALGAANLLLPLTVTDGGKIVIDIICLLRGKRSISTKYLDVICFALMIGLFITTFFLDISRIVGRLM
ncbi:M50 family metallopeptidase [Bacillus mexicanus]|uniref:site-2 protease family protein n=1 Tax=Bacillus mexicanus TaxID=2834415 RepID=UPI003D19E456